MRNLIIYMLLLVLFEKLEGSVWFNQIAQLKAQTLIHAV